MVKTSEHMHDRPLISAGELNDRLGADDLAVIDCRFYLAEPDRGESEYLESHIPGAIYAHLDRALSAPKTGTNGRHPLPEIAIIKKQFSDWGIDTNVQVVAYDADAGQIAARLWWMLRYLGHEQVAVLEGGFGAWAKAGHPTRGGREERSARSFQARPQTSMRIDIADLLRLNKTAPRLLIDARDPVRYRGDKEPIDPVGGHIPGARNRPWQENLDQDGFFLSSETLKEHYARVFRGASPDTTVVYCGSGVTACHDLLAMEHAGIRGARLYPGSWSEWCADPARPVETGPEPQATRPPD